MSMTYQISAKEGIPMGNKCIVIFLTEDTAPIDLPATKAAVKNALEEIYPARAGDFTQALMELGATVCLPNGKPLCAQCPCSAFCRSCRSGRQEEFPVRLPKRGRRSEEKTVLILRAGQMYALCKRPDKGLLASLWQFPDVSGKLSPQQAVVKVEEMGLKVRNIHWSVEKKHIFTHIEWRMIGYYMEVEAPAGDLSWKTAPQIETLAALPTAYRQFWEETADV